MDLEKSARTLIEILGLKYHPIAVKFFEKIEALEGFEAGGRLDFSTAILQATCVDVTILPFLTQKMNATLGCYGCREATNLTEGECVLGFPIKDLEEITLSLQKLNEKALPRVRGKTVYKALMSRKEG